jgi:hypothetical protein
MRRGAAWMNLIPKAPKNLRHEIALRGAAARRGAERCAAERGGVDSEFPSRYHSMRLLSAWELRCAAGRRVALRGAEKPRAIFWMVLIPITANGYRHGNCVAVRSGASRCAAVRRGAMPSGAWMKMDGSHPRNPTLTFWHMNLLQRCEAVRRNAQRYVATRRRATNWCFHHAYAYANRAFHFKLKLVSYASV